MCVQGHPRSESHAESGVNTERERERDRESGVNMEREREREKAV